VHVDDLQTPAALVDLDRLERNAARMAKRAQRLGVRLRPHVKTHKCVEAARIQTAGAFGGITVSTLAEARVFAAEGFNDITYAVPSRDASQAPTILTSAVCSHTRATPTAPTAVPRPSRPRARNATSWRPSRPNFATSGCRWPR